MKEKLEIDFTKVVFVDEDEECDDCPFRLETEKGAICNFKAAPKCFFEII